MKIKAHRNGIYYAHLTGGVTISLRTTSKSEAVKTARAAKLAELEHAKKLNLLTAEAVTRLTAGGRVSGLDAFATWKEWADLVGLAPSTVVRYAYDIEAFLRDNKLETASVAKATEKMVDAFVNSEGPQSAATRRNRLSALQSFYTVCVTKGFCVLDPSRSVRVKLGQLSLEQKEPAVRLPFTDIELELLRSIDDPFWKTFVLLGEHFGLRISDVAQLEWASIRQDTLLVWTDKHDKRIELPLPSEVREHLESLPKLDPDYVFPDQASIVQDPTQRSKLSTYFSRILKRIGIEGKNTHNLRHTFASRRSDLGDSIDEIREKLGHTSTETTEIYVHKNPNAVASR